MRVLFSASCDLWLTREAVLLARELGATWASVEHMPVRGEPDCWIDESDDREETYSLPSHLPRHDPVLGAVFDRIGAALSPDRVVVADIPDDVVYSVSSYNSESIAEVHRVWHTHAPEGSLSETVYCFSKDSTFEELRRRYSLT
jgi:hypothetical protein